MKYLVIGAGGTGGCIAGYLAKAGKKVTLIARGEHLRIIQKNGLTIHRMRDTLNIPVDAMTEQEYLAQPVDKQEKQTIFVCVKGYSLENIYPFLKSVSGENTIIVPILNIYGTGEKIAERLPGIHVCNGCIYIAAAKEAPGVLRQSGEIFRIVYGYLDGNVDDPDLKQIQQDLMESEITPLLSTQVRKDTFQKYSFVSPMAAAGVYYDTNAGCINQEGKERELFIACVKEIQALSNAMGIPLPENILEINLKIMADLADDCTASMQKDLKNGSQSEIEGLIYEVVRMGETYHVEVPAYRKIAEKMRDII